MSLGDTLGAARQCVQLHSLDICFDQIEAIKLKRVETHCWHLHRLRVGVIDLLSDELAALPFFKFETAETGWRQIIRLRDFHRSWFCCNSGMNGARIKTVVDRNVTGKSIVDWLLSLDRD